MSDANPIRTPLRLALVAAATSGLLWACTTAAPTGATASATSATQAHASLGAGTSTETMTAAAADANAGAAAGAGGAAAGAGAGAGGTNMEHAKATFQTVCSGCHEASLATDLRNTRRAWEQVVDRMFGFGMSATDAQVKEIVDYLSTTYPAQ